MHPLGKPTPSKTDEFSEKFQTAFDPPPYFRKVMLQFFSEIHDRTIVYDGKNLQYFWIENDTPPPLDLFRKFIRFGRGRRPLFTYNNNQDHPLLECWS